MAPKIPTATHNMATQLEDEPLPCYLFNVFIDPETGEVLHFKYLIKSEEKEIRDRCQIGLFNNLENLQTNCQEN